MIRSQFSPHGLMLAMPLIGFGLFAFLAVAQLPARDALPAPITILLWFSSGPLVGAGFLAPCKHIIAGAIVGLLGQIALTWYVVYVVGIC